MSTPSDEVPRVVQLVALCGSARPGSHTRQAVTLAAEAARITGAEIHWVDLAEWKLPLFDDTPATVEHPEVVRFKALIKSADALLVGTPVYHDSVGGSLKNALDYLYLPELGDKVAGLIAVGGGRLGQHQALEHLRGILRETSTWTLPRQVAVPTAKEAFAANGKPVDKELELRLTLLGRELVLRTRQLRPPRPARPVSPPARPAAQDDSR